MAPCYTWDELNELADGGDATADVHVRECAVCRERLRQLSEMSQAARGLASGEALDLRERIVLAVDAAHPLTSMPCKRAEQLLDLYLDGALPAEGLEELEAHLFTCEPCYAQYRATLEVRRGLSELGAEAPPEYLRERVYAAVEAAQTPKVGWRAWHLRAAWQPLAAAAVFAVVVLGAVVMMNGRGGAPVGPSTPPVVAAAPVAPRATTAKPQSPMVAAKPSVSAPIAVPTEKPSMFRRAADAIARATGEKPVLGGGTTEPAAVLATGPRIAPIGPQPTPSSPTIATAPTPTTPLIASVERTTPAVPHMTVAASAIRTPATATIAAAPSAAPSTPDRRPQVIARATAPVAPVAPTTTRPPTPTPEPTRIADASDSHIRWLPVRQAEVERVVAAKPAVHQLQDTARRVNIEIAQDERRSYGGLVLLH
jgi:predicted anti-sigma-YlaC factor YlaD